MADRETFVTNAAESTLSSSLAQAAATVNVTSTSGFPAVPFYATIDPGDDSKREVVRATAKTATTLTIVRGEDGTSDVAHASGATIAVVPVAALWTDINDRVEAHNHSGGTAGTAVATANLTGHDKAAHTALGLYDASDHTKVNHDSLGLDHGSLSGLSDDDHPNLLNEARHDALDHSGLTGVPVVVSARKTADETVNNSATLQDDDHLAVSLSASTSYVLSLFLDVDASAMSSNTLKGAFSFPSGSTLTWSENGQDTVTGTGTDSLGIVGSRKGMHLRGIVTTDVTSGSLQFRWAQSGAEAVNLVLKAGSWLRAEKVG